MKVTRRKAVVLAEAMVPPAPPAHLGIEEQRELFRQAVHASLERRRVQSEQIENYNHYFFDLDDVTLPWIEPWPFSVIPINTRAMLRTVHL